MSKQPYMKQKDKRWLLPRLVNKYKQTTLMEKLAGYGSILFLLAMITLNGGGNILWVVLGVASIILMINLMLYQSRLIFAGLVLALHVAFIPYAASIYALASPGGYTTDLATPILVLSLSTFILCVLAYRFTKGRYWVTLLYTFAALDLIGLMVVASTGLSFGAVPGLVLALAVIVIRSFKWGTVLRKPDNYLSRQLVNKSQDDITEKFMKKQGFNVKKLEDKWPLGHVAYSSEGIFLIATLTPSSVMIVNKDRFYYDGAFLEPLLHRIAEESEQWSQSHQIDTKYITTVALVNNEAYYPTADNMLSISIKEKGSRNAMGIYLATQKGVKTIMDNEQTYVPKKILEKVSKETNIELAA